MTCLLKMCKRQKPKDQESNISGQQASPPSTCSITSMRYCIRQTTENTYKEFLKTDFPRVPYPDPHTFWALVKLGGELRQLHLLDGLVVNSPITTYPMDGDNTVTRKINQNDFDNGKVWINDQQYFDGVPAIAWEFYIGGYQPAQKWLKDRHGRALSFEDILHYQKIIVALTETHRIMQEIDAVY